MAEKVTVMVLDLKVDLACSCCYKKVKKVLCKFPQIRDQEYDVKQNKVKITIVCCNPEKMRDMLCCKGRKVIKSIEIKEPGPSPAEVAAAAAAKDAAAAAKDAAAAANSAAAAAGSASAAAGSASAAAGSASAAAGSASAAAGSASAAAGSAAAAADSAAKAEKAAAVAPPHICCGPCYKGYSGGPCYCGYGRPVLPLPDPCYDGYEYDCRYRYTYGYGGNKSCCVSNYFGEENPQGCTIM